MWGGRPGRRIVTRRDSYVRSSFSSSSQPSPPLSQPDARAAPSLNQARPVRSASKTIG